MASHVPYVMSIPKSMPFRAASGMIGSALIRLFPARVARFESGQVSSPLSRIDRLLIAGIYRYHESRNSLERLAPLFDAFWRADSATDFHRRVAARFESVFLPHHAESLVQQISSAMERFPAVTWHTFTEIGCGSGRVLDYFRTRLPSISLFVGVDLSEAQVESNRLHFVGTGMAFTAVDGAVWVANCVTPGLVAFTYGGVFEYFPAPKVLGLMQRLAGALQPSMLVLVEPLADEHDLRGEASSVTFGHESTWSHNYARLCKDAGLEVVYSFEQRIGGQRWLQLVALSSAGMVGGTGIEPVTPAV